MLNIEAELNGLELKDEKGRVHVADPELVAMALQVIELYKIFHEKYTGHAARVSRASIVYFYRAAVLAKGLKISPEELVARQFKSMSRIGIYRPTCISSADLLEESFKTSDVRLDELRRYKANIELYNSRTTLYGSELALRDSTNEFSPLFRVVMAHKLGLKEIVDAYYDDAVVEYQTTPVAKEVFQGDLSFLHPADRT